MFTSSNPPYDQVALRSWLDQFLTDELQSVLAGPEAHKRLVEEIIRRTPGDRVLDLGSGSSAIVTHLPDVRSH